MRWAFGVGLLVVLAGIAAGQPQQAPPFVVEQAFVIEFPEGGPGDGALQSSTTPGPRSYVVIFTSASCSPCQRIKRETVPALLAAGVSVRLIDVNSPEYDSAWGVALVPEVRVIDLDTRRLRKKWVGFVSAATVQAVAKPAQQQDPAPVQDSSHIYNGQPGSSHRDRASLIAHLLEDGIHRGRHSRAALEAMTDQQLSDLHDADHNSSQKRPPQWVRPGTQASQSTGRVRGRGGLFFRWR